MLTYEAGGTHGRVTVGTTLAHFRPALPQLPGVSFQEDDPVFSLISNAYVVSPNVDASNFFGTTGSDTYKRVRHVNRGLPPVNKEYNPLIDFKKYSNPFGSLFDRPGFSDPIRKGRTESQVAHASLEGSVTSMWDSLYTYDEPNVRFIHFPFLAHILPKEVDESSGNIKRFGTTNHDFPTQFGTDAHWYGVNLNYFSQPYQDLVSRLVGIETFPSATPYLGLYTPTTGLPLPVTPVYGWGLTFSAFNGVSDLSVSDSTVTYTLYSCGLYFMRRVKISYTPITYSVPASGTSYYGRDVFGVIHSYDYEADFYIRNPGFHDYYEWSLLPVYSTSVHHDVDIVPTSVMLSTAKQTPETIPELLKEEKNTLIRGVDSRFRDNLGDFRPSVMFSFSDAIGKFRLASSNYIEVIAEADELFALAPDLLGLFKAFHDIESGRILTGLVQIADFFSNTYLLASFGWRPLKSNIHEVSSKIDRIGSALKSIQSPGTYNGKFSFRGDFHGFNDVGLTTRSKVVFGGVSNDFVINTLKLDTLGLLPRSSNLWDLVPWSWFVDYFTNLGSRYEIIDACILGLMMDVKYCVHSYRFELPLSRFLLRRDGLIPVAQDPSIVLYYREVSKYVPMIFDSDIDFGAPQFAPDKGIIAALLWQLLAGDLRG